jgi:hypothetical protein
VKSEIVFQDFIKTLPSRSRTSECERKNTDRLEPKHKF